MSTGGPPALQIGALNAMGFAVQSVFGTPVAIPANANNWIEWKTRAIKPNVGRKLYATGAGARGDMRKRGRSKSNTGGTFSLALQNIQGVPLIAHTFGCDDSGGTTPANATTLSAPGAIGDTKVTLTSVSGYSANAFIKIGPNAAGRYETHQILSVVSNDVNFKNSETLARAYAGTEAAHTVVSPFSHLFSNALTPPYLTLAINRSGQWYQVQDVQLDQLALALTGDDEWHNTFTVLGGNGLTEIAAPTPTFATDIDELNLADLTAATLLASVPVTDLASLTYLLKNGIKQGWTGGSYYPQKQAPGEFDVSGDLDMYFDAAAAVTMLEGLLAGTEGSMSLTIGNHTIAVPNNNLLEPDWTDSLPELGRVKTTWQARAADACTWTTSSTTAWAPFV